MAAAQSILENKDILLSSKQKDWKATQANHITHIYMINILIITGWLDVSGTETFIMNVLRAIDRTRFHIDFLLFNRKDTRYSQEAEALGCHLFYLPPRNKGFFQYIKSLDTFFHEKAKEYSVVHYCGGSLTSVAPLYFAKKYGIRTRIAHAHSTSTDGMHNHILHRFNKLWAQSLITECWGCSSEACRFFFGNRGSIVLKNGVDLNRFSFNLSSRQQIREGFSIPLDAKVLGHIGRFVPLKNQAFVVDIFNEFKKMNSTARLLLIGIGPEFDNVYGKVKQLGLENSVIFTKERADIPELLSGIDCLLMPSLYEGLPFVLVEAQAADTPCLVSDTISPECKISDGVGFMSLLSPPDEWAKAADNLITIPRATSFHKDVAKQRYDINQTVQYIENIYNSQSK
ncbi:MAG: glycosyltransferase family 1 protein [Muribaculaceae bacterium]|nr:glycosyltransferase family 1 protein [Muribaculaceae bacterium]